MLLAISSLLGFAIEAADGRMGTVGDFLFDDASWRVRWLVVDCGGWLTGRKVLVHPSAISYVALEDQEFNVELTRAEVESSPECLEHQPVSRRMERRLFDYYGWDPLWDEAPTPGAIPGAMAKPSTAPPYLGLPTRAEPRADAATRDETDDHLRSALEVSGYRIDASDGEIGHIENFLVDDEDWRLRYLIVDTSHWGFGKHVLIAPQAMESIDWSSRRVRLNVSRRQVETSPPWDPLVAFDEINAERLREHYGWPKSAD